MLFIDGSSQAQIRADIVRHSEFINITGSRVSFEDCLLLLAQSPAARRRLIVYDNVDDPDLDLYPLLLPGNGSTIIITSRYRSIGLLSTKSHLELYKMSMDEAIKLLLSTETGPKEVTAQGFEDVRALADALGCLPIALEQARIYMYHVKISAGAYLERLSKSRDKLLSQPVKNRPEMPYISTYAAFGASIENLPLRGWCLLQLLSFFHWRNFPLELISTAGKHEFSDYKTTYTEHGEQYCTGKTALEEIFHTDGDWDMIHLDELMVLLQSYSLIVLSPGVDSGLLEMHPLLHGWIQHSSAEEDRLKYQSAAIVLLALGDHLEITQSSQFLASHVAHLAPFWGNLDINSAAAFGNILRDAGNFQGALQLQEEVVSRLKRQADPSSVSFVDSLRSLGVTYRAMSRLREAEEIQVEALKLRNDKLGQHHLKTLAASHDLATTYFKLGRLSEAEALLSEVLKKRNEVLGEQHPDTLRSANNLAITLRDMGRLIEAESLRVKVVQLQEETLGRHHFETVGGHANLAITYGSLGLLDEAKVIEKEVLGQRKEILGERHPVTISAACNLALTYSQLGCLEEANALKEKYPKLKEGISEGWPLNTTDVLVELQTEYVPNSMKISSCQMYQTNTFTAFGHLRLIGGPDEFYSQSFLRNMGRIQSPAQNASDSTKEALSPNITRFYLQSPAIAPLRDAEDISKASKPPPIFDVLRLLKPALFCTSRRPMGTFFATLNRTSYIFCVNYLGMGARWRARVWLSEICGHEIEIGCVQGLRWWEMCEHTLLLKNVMQRLALGGVDFKILTKGSIA